jgi:hypothetical protein
MALGEVVKLCIKDWGNMPPVTSLMGPQGDLVEGIKLVGIPATEKLPACSKVLKVWGCNDHYAAWLQHSYQLIEKEGRVENMLYTLKAGYGVKFLTTERKRHLHVGLDVVGPLFINVRCDSGEAHIPELIGNPTISRWNIKSLSLNKISFKMSLYNV